MSVLADVGLGVLVANALVLAFVAGAVVGYVDRKRDRKAALDQAHAEGFCEGLARGQELAHHPERRETKVIPMHRHTYLGRGGAA